MSSTALAQGHLGGIHGTVRDQQGALLRGVTMNAISPDSSLPASATSDDNGYFRILNVPPGSYEVVATLDGFAPFTRANLVVRAGLTVSLDITLQVGGVEEGIKVTADAPLLESRTAVRGVNVDGDTLRSLPLSERRNWYDVLTLAPGFSTSESASGPPGFFAHGASQESNVALIDGADVGAANTNLIYYTSFSTEIVEDIQVKTAAMDAASPLGEGAIVSIVTKSGTNQLRGAAAFFYQNRRWNSSNVPGGTSRSLSQWTPDLALGGPVLRDRLWYFGAYRHTDAEIGISRSASQLATLQAIVPSFQPYDSTNVSNLYFVKPTLTLGRHRLNGAYQHNVNPTSDGSVQVAEPQATAVGGDVWSTQVFSAWTNRLTSDVSVSRNTTRRDGAAILAEGPLRTVYQSINSSGATLSGSGQLISYGAAGSSWSTQPLSKLSLAGNVSYDMPQWLGAHTLQSGFYVQRLNSGQFTNYVNNGFAQQDEVLRVAGDLTSGTIPFHRTIYDSSSFQIVASRTSDVAFYVQDTWRVQRRLTITPGVRVDLIRAHDRIFDVRTQQSVDVGPRLGINYALTGDARTVLRASVGRVHESPVGTGSGVGSAAVGRTDLYDRDLDGVFETGLVTPPLTLATAGRILDPDKHQPYIDEFNVELQRQLRGQLAASLGVTRRAYRDRGTLVETNGLYEGSVFRGYNDIGFNEVYRSTNNTWNWPVYTSLEAAVTKSTSTMTLIGSYTRQWRHLAGTWQPNDPAAFIQHNAFANDKNVGSPLGSFSDTGVANSFSNRMTAFFGHRQWQDHTVRLGAAYQLPRGIGVGGSYVYQSGIWSGPIFTRVNSPDPQFGPPTITLANGRQVQNPLSTLLTRFNYSTRGEGQLATPGHHVLDLRVAKRSHIGGASIEFAVDVYNVTNHDADRNFLNGATDIAASTFGQTSNRQTPRSAQISLRVSTK